LPARILKEINERLGFLVNVGLGYLAMSRNSAPCQAVSRSVSDWRHKLALA
jgi:excinuclease UvrABC ATPase subunit